MRKVVAALGLAVLAVIVWLLITKTKAPPVQTKGDTSQNSDMATALTQASPRAVAIIESNFANITAPATSVASPAPAGTPTTPEFTAIPAAVILDNVRTAIRNFGSAFGENPVGTNLEITEALLGKNTKGINFITPEAGLRVDGQGEMVDAYGTPFFFHQLSGKEMEIRSAGEDRKMWTSDDLVTR